MPGRELTRLFDVSSAALLGGVRSAGGASEEPISDAVASLLIELNLVSGSELSAAGQALFRSAWIRHDDVETKRLMAEVLRTSLALQVIEQELRGFGSIPEDGVLNLLKMHGVLDAKARVEGIRATVRWLSSYGVLVYSQKHKTIRINDVPEDAAKPGEVDTMAAMISPRTPFSNVVRVRRILRASQGTLTWADPHFAVRALEELVDEIDPARVRMIRILSGNADNVVNAKGLKLLQRFHEEMANKGICSDWRVDNARDWHDRWLVHDGATFNMPPVNNLYQGQYSEILPSFERPAVDVWWSRSASRLKVA